MSDAPPPDIALRPAAAPESTNLLLTTFAEFYRQEVGASEDVHRSLPFFGTALGIVIAALAYAAGRLPKFAELTTLPARFAFGLSAAFLLLAVIEAGWVMALISRALARQDYQRIGPETVLRARLRELQRYHEGQGVPDAAQDAEMLRDMREALLDSYMEVTPINRGLNQERYRVRALASSHLVRSLIWALGATMLIFIADKIGYLPKVL